MSADLDAIDAERVRVALRPFRGRSVDTARPVRVYRNLSGRHGRWSVLQGHHVVAHADRLMLADVTFLVSAPTLARSRRAGKKLVCAFAVGTLTGSGMGVANDSASTLPVRIAFEPKVGAFVSRNVTHQPQRMTSAWVALLNEHGLTAAYTDSVDL